MMIGITKIGDTAMHPDAVRRILAYRAEVAGFAIEGFDRLSAHVLQVGFITEAYAERVRDEDIVPHTRHSTQSVMRGYVQCAGFPAFGLEQAKRAPRHEGHDQQSGDERTQVAPDFRQSLVWVDVGDDSRGVVAEADRRGEQANAHS